MKNRRSAGDIVFNILNYTFFGIFTLLCFIPFYYLFINTISDNALSARGLIIWRPVGIHFQNYIDVMRVEGIGSATLVTLARTVIGTTLSTLCTCFLGYAFSKKELWHHRFWYRFMIVTMYFGAGMIPTFVNIKNLHLMNNFLVYIIPGLIGTFNVVLFKTYVESIPSSLEESADLDGAGYFTKFSKIVFPLCKPIVATLVVFSAVGHWNSYMDCVMYIKDEELYTLQFILFKFLSEANVLAGRIRAMAQLGIEVDLSKVMTPTAVKMTISMVVVIPVLLVYPLFQKYFVGGIMIGAVKG